MSIQKTRSSIKNIVKSILSGYLAYLYRSSFYYQKKLEKIWENNPDRTHKSKEKMVESFKKRFSLEILVETGTAWGEMVFAMKDVFRQIYSIELSHDLHRTAKGRLRRYKNIKLLQGDSGKILPALIKQLDEPGLFWLDAHFSGGETAMGEKLTPVVEEIKTIVEHPFHHVLLIDDATGFGNENEPDYPSVDKIREMVWKSKPNYIVEVKEGVIQIYPKR